MITTVLWSTCHAPVPSLLDASVMASLNDDKSSYGRFRLWGKAGNFLSSAWMGRFVHTQAGIAVRIVQKTE